MILTGELLDWGSRKTNVRGRVLFEKFADLDMVLTNIGTSYTFRMVNRGLVSVKTILILISRHLYGNQWQIEIEKSAHKMACVLPGWTAEAFEGDMFSATSSTYA